MISGRIKLFLASGFCFFVLLGLAKESARYTFWGRTVDAVVTEVRQVSRQNGNYTRMTRDVQYRYQDREGTERYASYEPTIGQTVNPGDVMRITYIPGDPGSELEYENHNAFFYLFVVGGVALAIGMVYLGYWEASNLLRAASNLLPAQSRGRGKKSKTKRKKPKYVDPFEN